LYTSHILLWGIVKKKWTSILIAVHFFAFLFWFML
jgi:hypothetical protein